MKKSNKKEMMQEIVEKEVFADPTLDVSFKMLFCQDKNKDILISLLNSLLNFKGKDIIIDVEINPSELIVSNISNKKEEMGITSAVDILCTNIGKQQIAIEMQGQKQKYFLTREQEYMAKLISGQVKEGQGKQYHEKVLDTYIVVIAKNNMFVGNTALSDQSLFEIDVEPRIVQTGEKYPGNKMHWKFYELEKFKESNQYAKIKEYDKLDEHSEGYLLKERFEWLKDNLKEQWLEFLVECNSQLEMPNRNELIKKGYNIMKLATWDPKDQVLYWKQKQNEIDAIQQKEFDKEEAFNQGKWKGEVKGEIKQIKFGLKYKMDEEKIVEDLKFLKKDNFPYIKEHLDETESQIMGGMDIEYQNDL
jgi:predicted transposase/invertase (TIGR01784 family)